MDRLGRLWSVRRLWWLPALAMFFVYFEGYFEAQWEEFERVGATSFHYLLLWVLATMVLVVLCLWLNWILIAEDVRRGTFLQTARRKMDTLVSEYPAKRDRYRWSTFHGYLWGLWNAQFVKKQDWPRALNRLRYWSVVVLQFLEVLVCGLVSTTAFLIWGYFLTCFLGQGLYLAVSVVGFLFEPQGASTRELVGWVISAWVIIVLAEYLWKRLDPPGLWRKYGNPPVEIIFDTSPKK